MSAIPIVVSPPNPSDGAPYLNQSALPLWNGTPTYDQVRQGTISDCYLLADLAAFAFARPDLLQKICIQLGANSYAVAFQRNGVTTWVNINADLPAAGFADTPVSCLWAALIEKAYAYYRTGADTYASLNVGNTATTLDDLGWTVDNYFPNLGFNWAIAAGGIAANVPVSTITPATIPPGNPLVSSHSYAVIAVSPPAAPTVIIQSNPWGWNPTDPSPSDPALIDLTIAQANLQDYLSVGNVFAAPSAYPAPAPPPLPTQPPVINWFANAAPGSPPLPPQKPGTPTTLYWSILPVIGTPLGTLTVNITAGGKPIYTGSAASGSLSIGDPTTVTLCTIQASNGVGPATDKNFVVIVI